MGMTLQVVNCKHEQCEHGKNERCPDLNQLAAGVGKGIKAVTWSCCKVCKQAEQVQGLETHRGCVILWSADGSPLLELQRQLSVLLLFVQWAAQHL